MALADSQTEDLQLHLLDDSTSSENQLLRFIQMSLTIVRMSDWWLRTSGWQKQTAARNVAFGHLTGSSVAQPCSNTAVGLRRHADW